MHESEVLGKRHSDTHVYGTIEVIEPTGEKNMVVVQCLGVSFISMVSPDIILNTNEKVKFIVDGRKLHVFDKIAEKRIV